VTHTDEEYMSKHNEVDGRAIYFISALESQPDILEMGFELTAYQPTLQPRREAGGSRIYQTIYLDQRKESLWTIGELKPECIIDRAWWSAFSHTYKHFRRVVPWVWTMQGHKHTWFAGSWTLFNTHDIAISSGLAAAHRLGAPYPFEHNQLATNTFDTVLGASHLRMRSWRVFRAALCALCCCGGGGTSVDDVTDRPTARAEDKPTTKLAVAPPTKPSEKQKLSSAAAQTDHMDVGPTPTSAEAASVPPSPPSESPPDSPPASSHGRGSPLPVLRASSAVVPATAEEIARCEA